MRRTLRFRQAALAGGVLCLCAVAARAAELAEVRLRPRAVVEGTVITLGDVATVRHRDVKLQSRLQRMLVAPAPRPGDSLRLTFAEVRSHLRDYGVDLSRVRFSGASEIAVRSGQPGSAVRRTSGDGKSNIRAQAAARAENAVAKAVQQYLARTIPDLGNVTIRARVAARDVARVLQARDGRYHIRGGRAPWDRSQVFAVRFYDSRDRLQEVFVDAAIERRPYVLAAKYSLPRGTMIRAEHVVWKQVADVKAGDITHFRDVVGQEATRTIRANERFGKTNVRKIPLVRSNELITVYAGRGGIRIARQMLSRGTGAVGDTIRAVSLEGRDQITVRVVGPREAEVVSSRSGSAAPRGGAVRVIEQQVSPKPDSRSRRRSAIRPVGATRRFGTRR